jgi:hypothetical protein
MTIDAATKVLYDEGKNLFPPLYTFFPIGKWRQELFCGATLFSHPNS